MVKQLRICKATIYANMPLFLKIAAGTRLVNEIIKSIQFLSDLRQAEVTPAHNMGDHLDKDNYR